MTREEAIEIFRDWIDEGFSYDGGYAVEELDDDGKEALNMAIKALSQEPCEDAISREYFDKNPCDDCIFEEGSKYCIEHCPHEAEADKSCGDAISREAVLKECHDIVVDGDRYRVVQEETLVALPSVTPSRQVIEYIKTEIKAEIQDHKGQEDDFSRGIKYGLRYAMGIINSRRESKESEE